MKREEVLEKKEKTIGDKLFDDRILFLGDVNSQSALEINMRLLFLESLDRKKDIFLFISSGGGSVTAGLSIYDTMNFISCDVWTVCMGMAASMGAFLLAGGTKGKRIALPNSSVMIHQPLQTFNYTTMQATEMQIAAKEIMKTRKRLNGILSENTGRDFDTIDRDTERDFWMTSKEAQEYGIVDAVVKKREDISVLVNKKK